VRDKDTRTSLLDVAQGLAQTRGFNGFSFHDLARAVGIRTASVHHHFSTKEDLARELMARYRDEFGQKLRSIAESSASSRVRLQAFHAVFRDTLKRGNRLCLCGMLASEYTTLPASVQQEVRRFYDDTERWLARTLTEGRRKGELEFTASAGMAAKAFLATLEGAMIAARTFEDERRLEQAGDWLLNAIVKPPNRNG
jgi:TetR/AcrR family transcriptional repressor of nem operon